LEFERRQTARKQDVAQIAEENPWPRWQFDHKPRNGLVLGDLNDGWNRGHISPY
jgi:hypothetical protein